MYNWVRFWRFKMKISFTLQISTLTESYPVSHLLPPTWVKLHSRWHYHNLQWGLGSQSVNITLINAMINIPFPCVSFLVFPYSGRNHLILADFLTPLWISYMLNYSPQRSHLVAVFNKTDIKMKFSKTYLYALHILWFRRCNSGFLSLFPFFFSLTTLVITEDNTSYHLCGNVSHFHFLFTITKITS